MKIYIHKLNFLKSNFNSDGNNTKITYSLINRPTTTKV